MHPRPHGGECLDQPRRRRGMHPCRVGMKAVDVRPVFSFGTRRGGGGDIERTGEGEGLHSAPPEVDRPANVRQGTALARRTRLSRWSSNRRLRSYGHRRCGGQGRTMFVPGGGVKLNWPGAIGSLTRGASNVNVFVLPCPSRMSTRSTCEVALST